MTRSEGRGYGADVRGRFVYSRWDGTQTGGELDAEALLAEIADDLAQHGDPSSALRRVMQEGMRAADGERVQGLRELLERIRQRRRELRESGDPSGVFDEIATALDDVIDEERLAIDAAVGAAERSGDERRIEAARSSADDRRFRLDMLPDDLAGRIDELDHYDFESAEAARRYAELVDGLRRRMLEQYLEGVSEAMESMSVESMERMKDMLAALNEMLDRRERGEDPRFEEFMERFGDFFPERPTTLDELLEALARRRAAAEALWRSMSPEQREQMQRLSERMLEDMDLRWQMDRLGERLRTLVPDAGWGAEPGFSGDDPFGFAEAMRAAGEMNELDRLEAMLDQAASPAQLAEVDLDRVRGLLGHDAATSLETLARLTETLREAGLVDQREGRLELTPRGMRSLGASALRELFGSLRKDALGGHETRRDGVGHERSGDTKPHEFGDPFRLDLHATLRNAVRRGGSGLPVELRAEDFEIERTEHTTRASTVLLLDLSMSMPMRGNFLPAKKVALALHHLIVSQFPKDYLGIVGFGETARELRPNELPEASWDFAYGTNMHHAFALARRMLEGRGGSRQIVMITDGEPTAHVLPDGNVFFHYPPVRETLEETLREVLRLTRSGIRVNTFMLDADEGLRRFVERMSAINHGRVFFTTPDDLGSFVLVDFLEHRRRLARRVGGGVAV